MENKMENLKVNILCNDIKNVSAMQQGVNQVVAECLSIGLNLNVSYETINKTFNSQTLNTDVVHGYGINPTEILALKGQEDLTILISSWDKVPGNWGTSNPINPCTYDVSGQECIEIMEEWYADYPEVLSQFLLHELSHYFYDKLADQGTPTQDLTHYQYANAQYSQKPPSTYYLALIASNIPLLKPSVSVPVAPTAILTRNVANSTETTGTLSIYE